MEPNPLIENFVKFSLSLNGLEDKVTFLVKGTGSEPGNASLSISQNWGFSHFDPQRNSKYIVQVDTLDNLVKEDVVLLKIDIEGFEHEVFKGSTNLFKNFNVETVICELKMHINPDAKWEWIESRISDGYFGFMYQEYNYRGAEVLDANWTMTRQFAKNTELHDYRNRNSLTSEDTIWTKNKEFIDALRSIM